MLNIAKTKKCIKRLFYPLNIINKLIPKKENQIVFYSNHGFRDNVRSLYDYIIENGLNENYKIICSLDDYKLYKDNKIENVKFISNISGLYYYVTSKYFFYSFGKFPISPSNNQVIFNLWHGMPLKTIGLLEQGNSDNKYDYFTHLLITSDYFSNVMSEAFGCSKEKLVVSMQPRNDELYDRSIKTYNLFELSKYSKSILWMPTFRKSKILGKTEGKLYSENELSFPIINSNIKLKKLNEELKIINQILIIKPHPLEDLNNIETENLSNIRIIDDKILEEESINLYNVISEMDAIITDYSSVYFDFLLLDRPIAFIIDDIEEYSKSRGFIIKDPLPLMPGHKIKNYNDLLSYFHDLSNENDIFENERNIINEKVNFYKSKSGCVRVLEISGILKEKE